LREPPRGLKAEGIGAIVWAMCAGSMAAFTINDTFMKSVTGGCGATTWLPLYQRHRACAA
jgi:hypothetical protein